jgi:alginate O-acetyltransferase complex protein AlgI
MSLSSWLRDYLYISLGGNRHGVFATYRNKFLTMLLGGLWHGANWTFVIWGAWHGLLLCIEQALGVKSSPAKFRPHRWLLTFFFVILGWVVFRAESAAAALRFYRAMFSFDGEGLSDVYRGGISFLQLNILWLACLLAVFGGAREYRPKIFPHSHWMPKTAAATALFVLFVFSVLKLSAQSYSPFLYFQF